MTVKEMEDKLDQYEIALDQILDEMWGMAVVKSEQRDNGAPFEEIEKTLNSHIMATLKIALAALRQQPQRRYIM